VRHRHRHRRHCRCWHDRPQRRGPQAAPATAPRDGHVRPAWRPCRCCRRQRPCRQRCTRRRARSCRTSRTAGCGRRVHCSSHRRHTNRPRCPRRCVRAQVSATVCWTACTHVGASSAASLMSFVAWPCPPGNEDSGAAARARRGNVTAHCCGGFTLPLHAPRHATLCSRERNRVHARRSRMRKRVRASCPCVDVLIRVPPRAVHCQVAAPCH
jgi:hypothetical protein